MVNLVDIVRKKLGLEPKRDLTVTGKLPNEVKINRLQNEIAGYPVFVTPRPGVVFPDSQYVGDDKNIKPKNKEDLNNLRRRSAKKRFIQAVDDLGENIDPDIKPNPTATVTPVPTATVGIKKTKTIKELFGTTTSGEHGSPKYGDVMYEIKPPKKIKPFKTLRESKKPFEKKIPLSSSFLEQRGVRHVKKYVFPYLSSEGKKKTVKEFGNIHSPSITNADTSEHGEKHDTKATHTHELASDHEKHKAGTKVKITHCSHDGKTIYAHTKEHGKIPLSKILKPKGLRTEAGGRYGWDVEKKIAQNIGSDSSAGASRHGHDFSYTVQGKDKVHGKIKVVEDKEKASVRGESKLDKGRAGITTLEHKNGKWQYGGDNKKIHNAFSKVKIKGEDGVHRSILDHMNHHHKNGNVTKGSSHDAKGSGMTRGYLEASDVNVLHLHHKNSTKSATVTVGNSLKGKTKLKHLHEKDIDNLDGRITIEPSSPGKVRLAHSLDSSAVKKLVHEDHHTLENKEHAKQFVEDIEKAHKGKTMKEEVGLVDHVQSIISEAKNMVDIKNAINHLDIQARHHARKYQEHNKAMSSIVSNHKFPDRANEYAKHAEEAMWHHRQYKTRLAQLEAGMKEGLDLQELSKGTLKSYIKKAEKSMDDTFKNEKSPKKWDQVTHKRAVGLVRAEKRLTKEDTDLQELSHRTLKSYSDKAQDSFDKAKSDGAKAYKPFFPTDKDKATLKTAQHTKWKRRVGMGRAETRLNAIDVAKNYKGLTKEEVIEEGLTVAVPVEVDGKRYTATNDQVYVHSTITKHFHGWNPKSSKVRRPIKQGTALHKKVHAALTAHNAKRDADLEQWYKDNPHAKRTNEESLDEATKKALPYATDRHGKKCERCGKGTYQVADLNDDIHNQRTCTKCNHSVRLYPDDDPKNEDLQENKRRGADSEGHKRPTEQGAGLTRKGVMAYRRQNPGSKLSTAVTTPPSKLKPGSKAANRRKSFCARMSGVDGPMKDEKGRPTRKAMSLRRWNCEASEILNTIIEAKKMKGEDPCWNNYEMVGTKKKNGRTVPNCVPKDN